MTRSMQTCPNLPGQGANRLRIGMVMLGGVVVSQVVASVATGMGPLPRWSAAFSTQKDRPQIDARVSMVTAPHRSANP